MTCNLTAQKFGANELGPLTKLNSGGSRTSGRGWLAHPDPEVGGGGGGGGWSQFGQFGLNMRAGGGACWVVPAFL